MTATNLYLQGYKLTCMYFYFGSNMGNSVMISKFCNRFAKIENLCQRDF